MDEWRAKAGVITVTEVQNDQAAATLSEQGWGYYNSPRDDNSDNCAVLWHMSDWRRIYGAVKQLTNDTYYRLSGQKSRPIYCCTVVLRRTDSKYTLLVSVTNLPPNLEGHWQTPDKQWAMRKLAYLSSLHNWSVYVTYQINKLKPSGALVVADWNLNLKDNWVRDLLINHWGNEWQLDWVLFPTEGQTLGGEQDVPPGAPGQGKVDRIIDGSLYNGLAVIDGPNLLAPAGSAIHRPFLEELQFIDQADRPIGGEIYGNTQDGEPWWGFGDYMDDEIYPVTRVFGND